MTLQRRLILWVLILTPLAWLLTTAGTYWQARHEINELYDTDMVRLAEQVHALLPALHSTPPSAGQPNRPVTKGDMGDAAPGDLAVSAWLPDGTPLLADTDGYLLPRSPGTEGFLETTVNDERWRVYYQTDDSHGWRIAVGQRLGERNELVSTYLLGQAFLWLIGLPLLLLALSWAVRQALSPVRRLSEHIAQRNPDDPSLLDNSEAPAELRPLIKALNHLIERVSGALEHERRLTADAAHELRTPLAGVRAQWELASRAPSDAQRNAANLKVRAGLDRMERLIEQLLALARLENTHAPTFKTPIDWQQIMESAISDCLMLSGQRNTDIEVRWLPDATSALPLVGDENLLSLLMRNLIDNAVRYSPPGSCVLIEAEPSRIRVIDQGNGVPSELIARLGDRFFRAAGQDQPGSGLGLSISRHIAHLHGLSLSFQNEPGAGLVVTLAREPSSKSRS